MVREIFNYETLFAVSLKTIVNLGLTAAVLIQSFISNFQNYRLWLWYLIESGIY